VFIAALQNDHHFNDERNWASANRSTIRYINVHHRSLRSTSFAQDLRCTAGEGGEPGSFVRV
jgi:hypothetical protein